MAWTPTDPEPSDWTRATSTGLYGLTADELRLVVLVVREAYEATGHWPSAEELRAALRQPGS